MTKPTAIPAKVILVFIMTVFMSTPVMAMGFSVSPQLPENQRSGVTGFFDLLVTPGQAQDIFIRTRVQKI